MIYLKSHILTNFGLRITICQMTAEKDFLLTDEACFEVCFGNIEDISIILGFLLERTRQEKKVTTYKRLHI